MLIFWPWVCIDFHLVRFCGCTGTSEPLLLVYMVNKIVSKSHQLAHISGGGGGMVVAYKLYICACFVSSS